jgi:hypothetical protein
MTPDSVPFFLTNRSDYHSVILFRHIRQSLAAAQHPTVELFCANAASKPEDEFHYLGLLWNCAFKAGIAFTGAHSGPPSPPPVMSACPSSPKILPPPARDLSALRPSTSKPFGSLRRRFHRRLQVSAPAQKPYPAPIPSPQPPQIRDHPSQLPSIISVPGSLPNEFPSSIIPSNRSSFIRRFRLRPKLPHWIRPPSSSHPP